MFLCVSTYYSFKYIFSIAKIFEFIFSLIVVGPEERSSSMNLFVTHSLLYKKVHKIVIVFPQFFLLLQFLPLKSSSHINILALFCRLSLYISVFQSFCRLYFWTACPGLPVGREYACEGAGYQLFYRLLAFSDTSEK